MSAPELIITNFNRNFTGVSATAANVVRAQCDRYDLRLVGAPLPGCPDPISVTEARKLCRGAQRPVIWHVRRNPEMRAAIWARDVLRLPVRIVFTSAAQRRHSAYPRWLISRMDAVIATTDAAASFVPHVRAVVPHGVDTALFKPAEDRSGAWADLGYGGRYGIAAIGRIRAEKGSDLFVDAMIEALPDLPGATALLIGRAAPKDASFMDMLRAKIESAGLSERILFTGEVDQNRLSRIMPAISLLVALPRYEGYGMTPLEAMSSAVPFVGSDTGYFKAFSNNGRAGQIVPIGAASAAAERIKAILIDGGRWEEMALAARSTALERHAIQSEVDGIAKVYEQLWEGR